MVVDMTAGSDSFASGMFTRFDMTFLVAEPTRKGVSVYRQYKEYARDFGVALQVVGNKVQGPDDLDFLRDEVGDDLLVTVGHSDWVRAMEKGRPRPLRPSWRRPTARRCTHSTRPRTARTSSATGSATRGRWCTST